MSKTDAPVMRREPSQLYRAGWWQLGLNVARWMPRPFLRQVARQLAYLYWWGNADRREVVIENLLPPLENDRSAAARCGRQLLGEFGYKLVDLWRYEAGLPIADLFDQFTGWENFRSAQKRRRGVLLLTVHLGNWEFGGPLLSGQGVRLHVITRAEPDPQLTEMRRSSRARWGIETVVLGADNAFGFVEIIRRLEEGATVALLMDRPAAKTALTVELFGRPFQASLAAAELARATGCSLLPVYLPRQGNGYTGHILEEIGYERTLLRDREARRRLTQQIMQSFEEPIRKHLTQWYHFIPIWPQDWSS